MEDTPGWVLPSLVSVWPIMMIQNDLLILYLYHLYLWKITFIKVVYQCESWLISCLVGGSNIVGGSNSLNATWRHIYIMIFNACFTLWIWLWWHVRSPLCKVCLGIILIRSWFSTRLEVGNDMMEFHSEISRFHLGFMTSQLPPGTTLLKTCSRAHDGSWCSSQFSTQGGVGWVNPQHHLQRTKLELQQCHWTASWNTWMNQYPVDGEKHGKTCWKRLFLQCFWETGPVSRVLKYSLFGISSPCRDGWDSLLCKSCLFLRVFLLHPEAWNLF